MKTLGERLRYARKRKGYTQESLAAAIGVSRGVIYNLEKNKTDPQTIVLNAICSTLKINANWLLRGKGDMADTSEVSQSAAVLSELYDIAKQLSETEQLYLLETVKALKQYISKTPDESSAKTTSKKV